jgi:hypothetical protein
VGSASNRTRKLGCTVLLISMSLVAVAVYELPSCVMMALRWNRANEDTARPLAKYLTTRERGVELAMVDMNIFGGRTRGWSSWILTETLLPIDKDLNAIASNEGEPLSRRFEASIIMYRRSKDLGVMKRCLALAGRPGDLATRQAREILKMELGSDQAMQLLNVSSDKEISPADQVLILSTTPR